jgi:ankyrin repeat protein
VGIFDFFGNNDDLCKACSNGATLLVKKLLEGGADANKEGDDQRRSWKKKDTPLNYAIRSGNIEVVKLLLDYGADLEKGSPLYTSAYGNYLDITRLLLERGACVDGINAHTDKSDAYKALWGAAAEGHADIVKLLLEFKANVEGGIRQRREGILHTPLAATLQFCQNPDPVSKLLVDAGAPVNLHLCSGLGDVAMMKEFIDKGADPESYEYFGKFGYTPLYFAVLCNKLNAVKLLLEHGVSPVTPVSTDILAKNYEDEGVLKVMISRHDNVDMLRLLIENGADAKKKISFNGGHTHLEYAKAFKRNRVVDFLEKI